MHVVNKKYLYFIFLTASILLIIVLYLSIRVLSSPNKNINVDYSQPSPTQTPFPSEKITLQNGIPVSPLQKTVISKTSETELLKRKDILRVEKFKGLKKYVLKSPIPLTEDEVYIENGSVIFESTSIFTNKYGSLPTTTMYIDALGEPDEIIESNDLYGWHTSAYIFAQKGYMLIANKFTYEVYEIERFIPMSIQDFKNTYGEIYLKKAPSALEVHSRKNQITPEP